MGGARNMFPAGFWYCLGAGALLPIALAPFGFWPLTLLAPAVLFWRLVWAKPGAAFALGWWFGFGKYLVGVSWVYVSINVYGGAPPWLAGALVLLFVGSLALLPALQAWLYTKYLARGSMPRDAVAFAASFVLLEWVMTWFLTGFPWLFLGYGHLETPLKNFAPVGGVLLVSLMTALSGCSIAVALATRRTAERAIAILLAASPWLAGAGLSWVTWVTRTGHGTTALVQGNVPQSVKWQPDSVVPILERYRDLSEPYWGRDLVVWPEAAVTLFVAQAASYLDTMGRKARDAGSALVLGIPDVERMPEGPPMFLNTAISLGDGSGQYAKRRLVPFGEYVPFEALLRGAIAFFDLPMSHAVAGPEEQPALTAKGWKLSMAICYEIVYPELVRRSAQDADLLITLSNDTWFGRSIGPLQHMEMARMRAVENGRWLLRATNDGVTAIVDADGRVVDELARFEAGVLDGGFHVMSGRTPFATYGSTPVVLLLFGLCLVGFTRRGQA